MQVGKNTVVTIDYTLKNNKGDVLDTSVGKQALPYLHGANNLIPGLERALEGKKAGDQVQVAVQPQDGYGQRDEKLLMTVPRNSFQNVPEVKLGMQFRTQGPQGQMGVVVVTKVEGDNVTVDGNHPLAGETLNFDVNIKEVRAATKDELAHGHVHGPGGHHH